MSHVHCFIVHCFIVHCPIHIVYCPMSTLKVKCSCTLSTVNCPIFIIHSQCPLSNVLHPMFNAQCPMFIVRFPMSTHQNPVNCPFFKMSNVQWPLSFLDDSDFKLMQKPLQPPATLQGHSQTPGPIWAL